jgi:pimeloyl-ACP methyl ester carboxylesterase
LPNARLVAAAIGLSIFGTAAAAAQSAATGNFSGRVDVGGRKIHVECKGAGAPTVILISGYRNNAEIWTVEPGPGLTPVFAAVAQFTRVCVYDRPGTVLDAERRSRSDPVPMPRSADAIVAELHATLGAAGINGPYVLAAHSLGGLFARLYTATDPQEIAGLVLVDAWQEDLEAILGPAQWAASTIPTSSPSTSPPRQHGCAKPRKPPRYRQCRSSLFRAGNRCSFRPMCRLLSHPMRSRWLGARVSAGWARSSLMRASRSRRKATTTSSSDSLAWSARPSGP